MISNPWLYLVSLIFIVVIAWWVEEKKSLRLFNYIPVVVILYIVVMVLANINLWIPSYTTSWLYSNTKAYLLPAMILVFLLGSDIRGIASLGKSMVGVFLLASLSIALGFVLAFVIFAPLLPEDSWRTLAALCGSWMGGTANMIAVGDALGASEEQMGFALIADFANYTIWVMLLLLLIPLAPRFNKWSGASMEHLKQIIAIPLEKKRESTWKNQVIGILTIYITIEAILTISSWLPQIDFLTQTTWVVLLSTLIAILGSLTPWSRLIPLWLGKPLLYLLIVLIASQASFENLSDAPLYIGFGATVLIIHLLLMLLCAKIFKLNLFALGVASLANIGGVASAPILAGAYAQNLVPVGVLMAMMGYIVGTFGGLAVGKILFLFVSV